ncbi:TadE-like protein [Caulifigura coniformis]|uniref:TadE-like protein n=1 Tax=Caulifigura coniformis TaxID=2527983 RepID=A0A517S7E9_9PLAN|nr:TadE/TadG family type IV pilus assembly protein [Caulifigura coniformis]QDT52047.1 TadE-like protein [Caulifigura coniformis]
MNVIRTVRRLEPADARSGGVTVETAIVLPVLFAIMFAAVDCARLNMIRNSAQNAAYEGARNAIVPGGTAADAKNAARKVLSGVGVRNFTVTVSPSVISSTSTRVTVTITVPLKDNSWMASSAKTTRNLIRSCTMSIERTRRT